MHAKEYLAALIVLLSLVALGACAAEQASSRPAHTPRLHGLVFFAHQSVGDNIIEGLVEIGALRSHPPLWTSSLDRANAATPWATGAVPGESWLVHARLGRNGDPIGKIRHFERMIRSGVGQEVDIVLMKLCFADSSAGISAHQIFYAYRETVRRIRSDYPNLVVVHVTMPLVGRRRDLSGLVRSALQLDHTFLAENGERHRFNELIRSEYGSSGRVFDLAALESERPCGRTAVLRVGEREIPILAREYTDDGGHLNAAGREMVATRLVAHLRQVEPVAVEPVRLAARSTIHRRKTRP